jgi:hypothetical protein
MNKDHQLLAEAYEKVLKEEADFNFNEYQPKEENGISFQERESLIKELEPKLLSIFKKRDDWDANRFYRKHAIDTLEQTKNPLKYLFDYYTKTLKSIQGAMENQPYGGQEDQYKAIMSALKLIRQKLSNKLD